MQPSALERTAPPTHTAVFFATEPFLKLFENTIADLKRMQDQVPCPPSSALVLFCKPVLAFWWCGLFAQVEEEIAKSIKGCAKEEEAYKSKIWAQNRAFQVQLATMMLRYISLGIPHQSNLSTFKDLDDRICGIGNIAMRIGTQANKQPTLISLTCL